MIRVADYIARTLFEHGIEHVFMVTGGGAMHLNDAIGRCDGLKYICCHHEQACTMAADSYFRLTNRLAAVNVTTGPGGTNAITGVFGAWTDSLGMVVVSGQVKWETLVRSTGLPLRQLGDQEVDIIRLVEPITKYAVMVTEPTSIRYHLERALHLARSGRPGPVWLDVPINVQGAIVDETALPGYDPQEDRIAFTSDLDGACRDVLTRLKQAERPVIMAGSGVRLAGAGAREDFLQLVEALGVPVTTSWNAHDVIWNEHPCYVGRPGTIGDRAGNFAVQNADFLLVLGCRLNIRQISYDWKKFARAADLVMVDVDANELKKPTLSPSLAIHADLADFLPRLLALVHEEPPPSHSAWLAWGRERARRYPAVLPEYWETEAGVNPYCFVDVLFDQLPADQIVVTGDGTACVVTFQAAKIQEHQRLYTNSGCASMGYDLPAAIGACLASGGRPVVCLAGDGSIQMNLQELQTIVGRGLPIKLFVLNNQGYHSIRQTQQNYFADNIVGCGLDSGLSFPDFGRLATAYGIPYRRVDRHGDLATAVAETLAGPGPQVCEVMLDLAQAFAPKLASKKLADGRMVSAPLEDLTPLLSREEFAENMIIPPLAE
ncbi:thiamine pyrophosphate-binding protein [Singulisphaera acidiphila]|uniref:Thiamine pyrophosphate-dependent enzyme, possible carboligase or decarboxylase n=1 Tax=Singulisphaera acidiphila (strain ATCC BAA-1392 / DSM 18658 / VKM B-2454 / MOB10) TaxID=886293 RepID=L0DFK2_SINAD|nr:thiamine pyrophosphate-binding protein [Singulisphaera acidiphila]AGA28159.1 thiamine pyrophosphate-dependent enzyme, possible carboligase or decarboxylase [Singulisphaera acidiphila DSM 18658]